MEGKAKPLAGSVSELKKSIGNLLLKANSDILDLQRVYIRVKDGAILSKKEEEKEKALVEKKKAIEDGIKSLEERSEYVKQENLEKFLKMMKTTVETADQLLSMKSEVGDDIIEDSVKGIQQEAKASLDEIQVIEEEIEKEIRGLSTTFSSLSGPLITV